MKMKLRTYSHVGALLGLGVLFCYSQRITASPKALYSKAPALTTSDNKLTDAKAQGSIAVTLIPEQISLRKGDQLKLTLLITSKGKDPIRLEAYQAPKEILLSFQTMSGVPVDTIEAFVYKRMMWGTWERFDGEALLIPGERYVIEFVVPSYKISLQPGAYQIRAKFTRPPQEGLWSGTVESNKVQLTYNP